jgi:hypothetical protein
MPRSMASQSCPESSRASSDLIGSTYYRVKSLAASFQG